MKTHPVKTLLITLAALPLMSGCSAFKDPLFWACLADAASTPPVRPSYNSSAGHVYAPPAYHLDPPALPPDYTTGVVETRIDGTFEGWSGATVWRMTNGQIWQQAAYAYHYRYAYRPEVLIYPTPSVASGWVMRVEEGEEIAVRRLE